MEETKDILRQIRDALDQQGKSNDAIVKQIAAVRPAEPAWKGWLASATIALVPMFGLGLVAWGQITTTQQANTEKINAVDKHLTATDAQVFTNQRGLDGLGYKLDRVQADSDKTMAVTYQLGKDLGEMRLVTADISRMRTDFQDASGVRTQQLSDLNTQLGQVARGLDENNSNTRLLSERMENMRQQLATMLGIQLPGGQVPVMPPATQAIPPKHFDLPMGSRRDGG